MIDSDAMREQRTETRLDDVTGLLAVLRPSPMNAEKAAAAAHAVTPARVRRPPTREPTFAPNSGTSADLSHGPGRGTVLRTEVVTPTGGKVERAVREVRTVPDPESRSRD